MNKQYRIHLREQNGGKELGWYLGVIKDGVPICSQGEFGGKQYRTKRLALMDVVGIEGKYNFVVFRGEEFITGDKTNLFGVLDVPKEDEDDNVRGQHSQDIYFFL